jgi:hypothetical protein
MLSPSLSTSDAGLKHGEEPSVSYLQKGSFVDGKIFIDREKRLILVRVGNLYGIFQRINTAFMAFQLPYQGYRPDFDVGVR